ncbi:antA/AntB antirepressor family protein [Bartonella sp. MM55XZML]|uniref:antA/AntB antirepressor family protein n=1 Tax=Bartonella sp. MM55XZML TaxID=3243552 RepID=UPI0035CEF0AF
MNTLIPISEQTIDQETVQTVNARDLHAFLEITSKFADWIKNRIKECNFRENIDFIGFSKNLEKGGRPSIEYHITLDMAKHLSMIERNDKGHEARQYFIKCEQLLKKVATPQIDYSTPQALLGVLNHLQSQIEQKDILLVDNMSTMCLLSNQVLEKHLKTTSGLVAEITNLPQFKNFDSLYVTRI